YMHALEFPWTF
nr:immunoglobulin light chain junction region [Macaca mulatta]MOX27895.1 immunoglobulin light chain junction region [Macaca mulatta]